MLTFNGFSIGLCSSPLNFNNTAGNNSIPGAVVAPNANGLTFTQGYFEIECQYPGVFTSGVGFPSFFLQSTMTSASAAYPHIEAYIMQSVNSGGAGSNLLLTSTLRGWQNSSTTVTNGGDRTISTPAGFSFSNFHKYGCLWTPSFVGFYIDNQLVSMVNGVNPINANSSVPYSTFSPEISSTLAPGVGGSNLCIGTGLNMTLVANSVGVWQA
jgi:hypothetical protein